MSVDWKGGIILITYIKILGWSANRLDGLCITETKLHFCYSHKYMLVSVGSIDNFYESRMKKNNNRRVEYSAARTKTRCLILP